MRIVIRKFLFVLSLLATLVPSAWAHEMIYKISISWTSGPLAGRSSDGYVSIDSSLAVPGAEYTAPNLLSRFTFKVRNQRYGISNVTTGFLSFDAAAQLRLFLFGTSCQPGSCGSQPGDPNSLYFVYDSESQLDKFTAIHGPPVEGQQSSGAGTLRLIRRSGGSDPFALEY